MHRELRRPNVTLMLLWEEYCDANSDSFSYAWFCERDKEWTGRLKPILRQVHVAGEKLFVDYSGHTMEVVDGLSGEARSMQIFVAVLGASNYTYAEASFNRSLRQGIAVDHDSGARVAMARCHCRADDFMMPPSLNAWYVVSDCAADRFVRLRARSAMAGLWLTDDLPAFRAQDNRTPSAGLLQAQPLRPESRSSRRASALGSCLCR
ncbi:MULTISPECIES: hypothetical protein [unclassified Bradyrhizobium]|uniref:hypothetical protein n=1 Tax=unclassified Bradyrhizobium TaxID=2631580 RepID=UPI001FFBD420|nr:MULTISPECIES: hypothetical protein [unclassified Bradyrhizobium]